MLAPRSFYLRSKDIQNRQVSISEKTLITKPKSPKVKVKAISNPNSSNDSTKHNISPTSQPVSIPNTPTTPSLASKNMQAPRNSTKKSLPTQDSKDFKDCKDTKDSKDSKDTTEYKEHKEYKEFKDMPSSVAALLASTSIPPPRRRSLKQASKGLNRKPQIEFLRQEWNSSMNGTSLGKGSPLDFLLDSESPAILLDGDDYDSKESHTVIPSRSMSSDSMFSTTPSLENEADMSLSSSASAAFSLSPQTPASLRKPLRTERKISSPPALVSVSSHPLLEPKNSNTPYKPIAFVPPPRQQPTKRVSSPSSKSTVSSLSLSLSRLKSAAKAFSNFTAPSLPSDDLLTRSLFSPSRYATSEMRPRSFAGVPDPAMRRYFNPQPISINDAHRALTDQRWVDEDDGVVHLRGWSGGASREKNRHSARDGGIKAVPLVTYARTSSSSSAASSSSSSSRKLSRKSSNASSITATAGTSMSDLDSDFYDKEIDTLTVTDEDEIIDGPEIVMPRQREPRENSDFLRVIVLEMNMRRAGKLDLKSTGHARVWLPPRAEGPVLFARQERKIGSGIIPQRWVGIGIDD